MSAGNEIDETHQTHLDNQSKYRNTAALFLIVLVTLFATGLLATAISEKNVTGVLVMALVLCAVFASLWHANQERKA